MLKTYYFTIFISFIFENGIICADLIKLGVLSVFLWMQDLNGVVF
ncbi:hypothetical protein [uncultured Gammaproteobacteria bacterium]|nr:hypothetical protein [uncultured Gammaproteobacteria bacterium]